MIRSNRERGEGKGKVVGYKPRNLAFETSRSQCLLVLESSTVNANPPPSPLIYSDEAIDMYLNWIEHRNTKPN